MYVAVAAMDAPFDSDVAAEQNTHDYADVNKTLLAENDDLFVRSRNLDINMLDLYSLFNRAVNRAKNT